MAVKVLHTTDEIQINQFCLEIKLLKSLSFDRNIVQFLGVCLHAGSPMLVSPSIDPCSTYLPCQTTFQTLRMSTVTQLQLLVAASSWLNLQCSDTHLTCVNSQITLELV